MLQDLTHKQSAVQWPFISIWNKVLPSTGRKIGGTGTIFQILMNADCMYLSSKPFSSIFFLATSVYFSAAIGHGNALDQNSAFCTEYRLSSFTMRILLLTCLPTRENWPFVHISNWPEAGLGPGM